VIGLVWAEAAGGVVGAGGAIPWHLPEDLAHFRAVTGGSCVIMGRRTWDSLPKRFRPLPGRRNVVLTRSPALRLEGAETAPDLAAALALVAPGEDVWVIGGGDVYRQALPYADRVVRTEVDLVVDGDTTTPVLDADTWQVVARDPADGGWHTSRTGLRYRFASLEPGAKVAERGDSPVRHSL
jgi:dihydrofolate reductase